MQPTTKNLNNNLKINERGNNEHDCLKVQKKIYIY